MNIRDFEYLIAIDELRSFVKASDKCFISQPALSQQVKKIEDQLGFKIFERDRKSIITTTKGEQVIKYARLIANYYKKIKEVKNNDYSLRVALIPTICPYLLPHIVDNLRKAMPEVRFYFLELKTDDLIIKLKEGEIDFGIIAYFDRLIDDKIIYRKLYDEEFLLALAKDSNLDQNDFSKIIEDKKLILLEEGNCISDNIKDICNRYNQESFSDFYATNIETVKNIIRISNGAALLPELSCITANGMKIMPFKSKKTREVGMVCRSSFDQKDFFEKFAAIISESFNSIKNPLAKTS